MDQAWFEVDQITKRTHHCIIIKHCRVRVELTPWTTKPRIGNNHTQHKYTRNMARQPLQSFVGAVLLLSSTVHASGGPNIFLLHTDLLSLAVSMTLLVVITIVFELSLHRCKHWMSSLGATYKEVFEKITAELTVLGFISVFTIIVAQYFSYSSLVAENLPGERTH